MEMSKLIGGVCHLKPEILVVRVSLLELSQNSVRRRVISGNLGRMKLEQQRCIGRANLADQNALMDGSQVLMAACQQFERQRLVA